MAKFIGAIARTFKIKKIDSFKTISEVYDIF